MVKKTTDVAVAIYTFLLSALYIIAVVLHMGGCSKKPQQTPGQTPQTQKTISARSANDAPTLLGNKLQNPYTVENMEQAKQNLADRGIRPKRSFTVRGTHLYVKFSPKNEAEYNALESEKALDLVDFPLDYEIAALGNWYREPGLDDATPTPQYAVVPSGYGFNENIAYEVLASLYLPELDRSWINENSDSADYEYMWRLMNETFGFNPPNSRFPPWETYPVETGANDGFGAVRGSDGMVSVFDTRLNTMLPVKGADILTLNGMRFYHGTTDNSGSYLLDGSFQGSSIVLVKMRKNDFTIRRNFFNNANIARPGNGTYCDVEITGGMERMYATMFRAAYRYNYGNVGGLQRPAHYIVKQVLIAKDDNLGYAGINYSLFPSLRVSRYFSSNGNDVEYGSDEIFGITIHELAHTAHVRSMNAPAQFNQVENRIVESWAIGVQWMVTNMEYREHNIVNYGDWNYNPAGFLRRPHRFGYQNWGLPGANQSDYTSIFINLVDDFNENGQFFFGFGTSVVNDPVTGYNLATIQSDYLKNVYGINSLSTKLKANKPTGVTDAQIDLLLSNY